MELSISPLVFILGMFLSLSHTLFFGSRIAKQTRKIYSELSPAHVIRKRRVLIFLMVLSLAGLMAFYSLGMLEGHPVLYRSVYLSQKSLLMAYLDTSSICLIKTMVFLSVSMIVPLLYKHSDTRSKSILIYSFMRISLYPYLLFVFYNYKYFSFFLTDLLELSESILLIFIFISLLKKIARHKETPNLFVQYESIFIYRRSKSSCLLFVVGTCVELFYYLFLIYASVNHLNIPYVMDALMILKLVYLNIILVAITNIICSKEQPIYDTLVSMYKMRLQMEDEKSDDRKRFKKSDIYKLTQ